MTRYISSADNLKLVMMLLLDESKQIQFEVCTGAVLFRDFNMQIGVPSFQGLRDEPWQAAGYQGHLEEEPAENGCVLAVLPVGQE